MNPCTVIVYNQTEYNMAVGSLRAADNPVHDGPPAGADLQSVPIKYVWQYLWQLSSKHLTLLYELLQVQVCKTKWKVV